MNTQITEDYVSFETAKLLKEKGFDWEWSPFYSEQDRDEWDRINNYNIPNPNYDANIPFDSEILNVIAPHVSLQMAIKWLRKVHNIHANPIRQGSYDDLSEDYSWIVSRDGIIYRNQTVSERLSHEEACEAAIKYCLTNLI